MNGRILTIPGLILATALIGPEPAAADPVYTLTNLGDSYQFQSDSAGHISTVVADDGRQFIFDKIPVEQISQRYGGGNQPHEAYKVDIMEINSHRIGYGFDQHGDLPMAVYFPGGEYWGGSGHGWVTPAGLMPVADINSHGQFIGQSLVSLWDSRWTGQYSYFAAFSKPNGSFHGGGAYSGYNDDPRGDNLNHYIAQDLGVNLTSAVKIDDLGQIIAVGTWNGKPQDFLLTPDGQPTPAPEPSSFAMLGCAIATIGIRSHLRRSRGS